MKKTMSLEQIEANRANARKSTGPRTAAEKAISKMNAMRHGILAREVVLRGGGEWEREREFQSLYRQFWEHLAPEGPMETMLVERMVTTYWRLHRVLIGERGEIARSVSGPRRRREMSGLGLLGLGAGDPESSRSDVTRSMEVLGRVRQRVQEEGDLTEAAMQEVMNAFDGRPNSVATGLKRVWDNARNDAENQSALEPPADESVTEALTGGDKALQLDRLLTYIDRQLTCYEWNLQEIEEHEEREAQANRDASFLPSSKALEKILRYESSLERQLYRAMNQLERLQRARKGEVVPPPLTMEIMGG